MEGLRVKDEATDTFSGQRNIFQRITGSAISAVYTHAF